MLNQRLDSLVARYSTLQWWLAAIVLTVISKMTQILWLDPLYVQSQFPVSFFVGQTTFNAQELKSYYAVLLERDTLNDYVWVQIADYLFMLTVFISHIALMAAAYRSLPNSTLLKKWGWAMIFIAPMAAGFDALENLVSFVMLANPRDFADWLVLPYSSFASLKFIIFGLSYLWVLAAIVISMLSFIARFFNIQPKEIV